MNYFWRFIGAGIIFVSLQSSVSCGSRDRGSYADSLFKADAQLSVSYDVKRPSARHLLPYVLEEISGLTFRPPHALIAVDDETGKVFEYDFIEKEIIHSIEFYKADDYEGVEWVDETVYVLKSDGDVFSFPYGADKKIKAIKYENELSDKNDTEGLGYLPASDQLLIACKEDGDIDDPVEGRAFYGLPRSDLDAELALLFTITSSDLKDFWEASKEGTYDKDRIKFKPSAIATHPLTHNIYILSSIGKLIVVVTPKGKIVGTYPISPKLLGQPEGLCFSPEGVMFIASEGEGDRGYILQYQPIMKK